MKKEELEALKKALLEGNPEATNRAIWFLIERVNSLDTRLSSVETKLARLDVKLSWILGVLGIIAALLIAHIFV